MHEINHDDYNVNYDEATATVVCTGSFRLRGPEYAPIMSLLNEAVSADHEEVTLDVRELQFLNSSGINTFSKFVIGMRKKPNSQLVIQGSSIYPWQKKSLKNFEKLLPSLQLHIG